MSFGLGTALRVFICFIPAIPAAQCKQSTVVDCNFVPDNVLQGEVEFHEGRHEKEGSLKESTVSEPKRWGVLLEVKDLVSLWVTHGASSGRMVQQKQPWVCSSILDTPFMSWPWAVFLTHLPHE